MSITGSAGIGNAVSASVACLFRASLRLTGVLRMGVNASLGIAHAERIPEERRASRLFEALYRGRRQSAR